MHALMEEEKKRGDCAARLNAQTQAELFYARHAFRAVGKNSSRPGYRIFLCDMCLHSSS